MKKTLFAFLILSLLFSNACKNKKGKEPHKEMFRADSLLSVKVGHFNSQRAYGLLRQQVELGPRVPGTNAHKICSEFLVDYLKRTTDSAFIQKAEAKTFDGKNIPIYNIIGIINPRAKKRIMLSAHWDTRPFADQDENNQDKPILGANDGASGVAVLLEISNVLKKLKPEVGVDIILFDAEDWGDPSGKAENSFCLGSQYWSNNPHIENYTANFGILLDMVGDKAAHFAWEGYSLQYAPEVLEKVWYNADLLGYKSTFSTKNRGSITDDHYYINTIRKIPTIDILNYEPGTSGEFGSTWHTHQDNLSNIDSTVLGKVGKTVLYTIFDEQ